MVIMRPPAAPPPIKYTSSCREDQRRSTEGKIVSKYCNLSKTQGEEDQARNGNESALFMSFS